MLFGKNLNVTKIVYIRSQNAEATPPLGTILGNIGVNTVKFCDEFNKLTIILPSYMVVKVKIDISDNKTFKFKILSLSLTFLINLLKFKHVLNKNGGIKDKEFVCIKLQDIVLLALFKFPKLALQESLSVVTGVVKSMNIKIIKI
jgi:ribosomal protein L11